MIAAIWRALERRGAAIAAVAAIWTASAGLIWGTYVAGGPDSYCHINQAELFVQGRVQDPQPIVAEAAWPDRVNTAVPVGHVAAPHAVVAAVPMCPPGYAASLAVARLVGGRAAMFWVVPLFGALAVWCTFLIGRRLAGAPAGLLAAVLLATSPAFLYQVVQPMSDVPAAATWAAALVVGLGASSTRGALFTGILQRRRIVHAAESRAAWSGDGGDRGGDRGSARPRCDGDTVVAAIAAHNPSRAT